MNIVKIKVMNGNEFYVNLNYISSIMPVEEDNTAFKGNCVVWFVDSSCLDLEETCEEFIEKYIKKGSNQAPSFLFTPLHRINIPTTIFTVRTQNSCSISTDKHF